MRDEQHPDGDIEISYTGLRPAEKLYEELLIGNNVTGTEHPMILRAIEHSLPWDRVQELLNEVMAAMSRFDCQRALHILSDVVAEYTPAPQPHDLVWARQSTMATDDRKVTNLKPRRIVRNNVPTDGARTLRPLYFDCGSGVPQGHCRRSIHVVGSDCRPVDARPLDKLVDHQ